MAYDEGLVQRIREALRDVPGIGEKKMFGGLCFTLGGNMMVGIVRESLMVRMGEVEALAALSKPGARPMDFTGKPMKGYLFVDPIGIAEDRDLEEWISMSQQFAQSLPVKDGKAPRPQAQSAKGLAKKRKASDK